MIPACLASAVHDTNRRNNGIALSILEAKCCQRHYRLREPDFSGSFLFHWALTGFCPAFPRPFKALYSFCACCVGCVGPYHAVISLALIIVLYGCVWAASRFKSWISPSGENNFLLDFWPRALRSRSLCLAWVALRGTSIGKCLQPVAEQLAGQQWVRLLALALSSCCSSAPFREEAWGERGRPMQCRQTQVSLGTEYKQRNCVHTARLYCAAPEHMYSIRY